MALLVYQRVAGKLLNMVLERMSRMNGAAEENDKNEEG